MHEKLAAKWFGIQVPEDQAICVTAKDICKIMPENANLI